MENNEGAPIVETKTQERLQAQVELFTDKGVKEFSKDQSKLLRYSSSFSKIKDLENLPTGLPEDIVDLIQRNKGPYLSFLRQEKNLDTSFIEQNIKSYKEKFQPTIKELKEKIKQENFKELSEYLGSGSNGSAFKIEINGKSYAAKFSREVTQINSEIKSLIKAKGIHYTAQLVNYSFEDSVVITELLPGTDVTNFTQENAPNYPDEHIINLIETIIEMDSKGLVIDPKPSNFMYDQEKGFSILDYHVKNDDGNYRLPQEIMSLIGFRSPLTVRKFEQLDYESPDYKSQNDIQEIEKYKIFLPMAVRFIGILKDKYPNILNDWQKQHDEDKKNPLIGVSEIIDRQYIPDNPELEPYLKKLEEMGY